MTEPTTPANDALGPLPADCVLDVVRGTMVCGYSAEHMRAERERCYALGMAAEQALRSMPTEAMEIAGMRALRNTYRTVSGAYSREQARACWDAMVSASRAERSRQGDHGGRSGSPLGE